MPTMPRTKRMYTSGVVCHVLNRSVGRAEIFRSATDYSAFEKLLTEACKAVPLRLLTFCLMPNHWHLVLWPQADRDLSVFMHRLTMTHTMRWHHAHQTMGTGPLYQGRFKSFPVASDEHFLTVCRYVERNALRANLVRRAEDWRWSGLWHRLHPGNFSNLANWPISQPDDWLMRVNQPHTATELAAIHASVRRSLPFGSDDWRRTTADRLGIQLERRKPGRPPR
jgi:putative transposase